jgi:hypothetical protein
MAHYALDQCFTVHVIAERRDFNSRQTLLNNVQSRGIFRTKAIEQKKDLDINCHGNKEGLKMSQVFGTKIEIYDPLSRYEQTTINYVATTSDNYRECREKTLRFR